MFRLQEPSPADVQRFLAAAATSPLSYADVGIAAQAAPAGYQLDTAAVLLGNGRAVFERAALALRNWEMFDLGWVKATPSADVIAPALNVAIVAQHLGCWSLNGCRVVYLLSSADGNERYGFAYGTLTGHAEAGEELFEVTLEPATGRVFYRLRAASRPNALLAKLGYPYARFLQSSFRADSCRRMQRAVHDVV